MIRSLLKLVFFCVVVAAIGVGYLYWRANQPIQLAQASVEFRIPAGVGLRAAAQEIRASSVPIEPWLMVVLGKTLGVEASIKEGSYEIGQGVTPLTLLRKLTAGDVSQADIVFIEGWTFKQIRDRLDASPDLRHDTRSLNEQALLKRLAIDLPSAEGWFFPDTYLFAKGSSDLDVLLRAHRAMVKHLEREWATRDTGLPYRDAYQALIMASIVEKETGKDQDRPMIAAVFANRLRQGMLLQTDPSVIYGLGSQFDGNLRKRDLQTDSPYNTYTRVGLPPTPIAMPGIASLQAALHPAASNALYFVARGDGSSQFSRTLDEHNQAVNRYQKGGKR